MFPELITELLQDGYKVSFCAPGHSMFPTIMANETIMVEPIEPGTVQMGDILLYRTNGRLIAHRVVGMYKPFSNDSLAVSDLGGRSSILSHCCFFIFRGDACAVCDEPVTAGQILGKVVSVERDGVSIDLYDSWYKLNCLAIAWGCRILRFPRRILSIFF
jgi:hypothetical protein